MCIRDRKKDKEIAKTKKQAVKEIKKKKDQGRGKATGEEEEGEEAAGAD